jgi:hemolysin D
MDHPNPFALVPTPSPEPPPQEPTPLGPNPIRILIVDDQNFVCKMLQYSLESQLDLEVVGMVNNGQDAFNRIEQLRPDIVLVDIEMPGMNGIAIARTIREQYAQTKVLILSSHDDDSYIRDALQAGAKGYLLKNTPPEELAHAIRFVQRGYLQLGPGLFEKLEESPYALKSSSPSEKPVPALNSLPANAGSEAIALSENTAIEAQCLDDWSPATKNLLDALPRPWTRGLLYLLIGLAVTLLPWAMFSKVDETGLARGRLEPKHKTLRLDAPVTGTVAAIDVKEGDTVQAGQRIMELGSEVARNDLEQFKKKQEGQQNRLVQLELLRNQLLLALQTQQQQNQSQQLEKLAQLQQAQQRLDSAKVLSTLQAQEKQAQLQQAQQTINSSKAAYEVAVIRVGASHEKVPRYKEIFKKGGISKDRYSEIEQLARESSKNLLKAEAEFSQVQSQLKEQQESYRQTLHQGSSDIQQAQLRLQEQQRNNKSLSYTGQLSALKIEEQIKNLETGIGSLKTEIAQVDRQVASLAFQLKQRILRAPASGIVFHLSVQSAGSVVQSGQKIVEIAPAKTALVLRAKMSPTESGSLRVGMPVKMKFDAYPFQDYGALRGRVSWVSPDSKMEQTERGRIEVYELEIEPKQSYLSSNRRIDLTPGQTATAEVIVRQRRVIDFILDPLRKLQNGGLEL